VNNNPVNATDPTGHAMKLDDEGNSHECPANTCYITMVGSTPALPYYPTSPVSYGQNAEETYTWGEKAPDVSDPGITIQSPSFRDPSAIAGAAAYGSDLMILMRNSYVEHVSSKINVFAFYKVEGGNISVKSLDVQNPTGSEVTVKAVGFMSNQGGYNVKAGPGINPMNGYYGIGPAAQPNSTTTIKLDPSGFSGNPTNTFSDGNVGINVWLVHTGTGMQYKWIPGTIKRP
jgi:hypothetical protein